MPKKTKKVLEAHAKAAAEERYGVTLNKEARREIVQKIQTGDADFVSRTSNNRTLWKVDYQETNMNVVYDKSRHAPVHRPTTECLGVSEPRGFLQRYAEHDHNANRSADNQAGYGPRRELLAPVHHARGGFIVPNHP